jgi:plasmid maintenance system killer protein
MIIFYRTKGLERKCRDFDKAKAAFGEAIARKLIQRLQELQAAQHLKDLPPAARCHPLKGKRTGQYAVHLQQPFRLILEPVLSSRSKGEDQDIELERVIKVTVVDVEDYH